MLCSVYGRELEGATKKRRSQLAFIQEDIMNKTHRFLVAAFGPYKLPGIAQRDVERTRDLARALDCTGVSAQGRPLHRARRAEGADVVTRWWVAKRQKV